MHFSVSHTTRYSYESDVVQSRHRMHLLPRATPHQTVHAADLTISPDPTFRTTRQDVFGNAQTIVSIGTAHRDFTVTATSAVETQTRGIDPSGFETSAHNATLTERLSDTTRADRMDVLRYSALTPATTPNAEIFAFAQSLLMSNGSVLANTLRLTTVLFETFAFDPTASDVATPISEVFSNKRGVCQDFTHLALACLRSQGVPCRYVSGYIMTKPPEGQQRLEGADASHAWISVWDPDYNWVDFDPTNGLIVNDEHVTVAYGRDFDDVSPIRGIILGGGAHELSVAVDVIPTIADR
ncbi:MAG: transglutaminase family protein [Pseudomonadota bacterium]